jgi:hypothetical protein
MPRSVKDETVCVTDAQCPECHQPLKPLKLRRAQAGGLICGGCGRRFSCEEGGGVLKHPESSGPANG